MKKSMQGTKKNLKQNSNAIDREVWAIAAVAAAQLPGNHWRKKYPPKIFTSPQRKTIYHALVCGDRSLVEISDEFYELKNYRDTIKMVNSATSVITRGYSFYAVQAAEIMLWSILQARLETHPLKPRKSRAKKGFTH